MIFFFFYCWSVSLLVAVNVHNMIILETLIEQWEVVERITYPFEIKKKRKRNKCLFRPVAVCMNDPAWYAKQVMGDKTDNLEQ